MFECKCIKAIRRDKYSPLIINKLKNNEEFFRALCECISTVKKNIRSKIDNVLDEYNISNDIRQLIYQIYSDDDLSDIRGNIVEDIVFNFRYNNTQIKKERQCVPFYNGKEINTEFDDRVLGSNSLTNFDVGFWNDDNFIELIECKCSIKNFLSKKDINKIIYMNDIYLKLKKLTQNANVFLFGLEIDENDTTELNARIFELYKREFENLISILNRSGYYKKLSFNFLGRNSLNV